MMGDVTHEENDVEERIAELRFEHRLAINRGDLTKADALSDAILKLRCKQVLEVFRTPQAVDQTYVHLYPKE